MGIAPYKEVQIVSDLEKQRAAEGLKRMQWDVELMMGLTPLQRRAIDDAIRVLDRNPVVDNLRSLLLPGHPLAE